MLGQSRIVKCGDHGRRVKQIQHSLASLGYEVGSVDGRFGLVTEEAVQSFQRDFQLAPDGVVGRKTGALLGSGLQSKFLIHRVASSENLRGVAQSYGLSTRVIAKINNLSDLRVTPGQTLRIPRRQVVGYCTSEAQPTDSLFRNAGRLDALVTAGLILAADGIKGTPYLREDLRVWIKAHKIELWVAVGLPVEKDQLDQALLTRKHFKKTLQELSTKIRTLGADGVVIHLPPSVVARHRLSLDRLFRSLRRAMPNLPISAILPLPTGSWFEPIDYRSIAKWSRWILLYPEHEPDVLGRQIRRILKEVPCWQLILGLTPSPDRLLKQRISLLTKYNLGGAWICELGKEGTSFWASLREEFISGDINLNSSS